jgi:hypothetical protein
MVRIVLMVWMVGIVGRRPMEEGGPLRWEEGRQTKDEKNLGMEAKKLKAQSMQLISSLSSTAIR